MSRSPSHPPRTPLARARRYYFLTLKYIVVLGMLTITALIFANVVLRYGFNSSLFFTEEVSRLMFVWLVFMGALLVLHERAHIHVDMLTSRLPFGWQKALRLLSHLIMLGITLLLLTGSWSQMLINRGVGAPATGIPMTLFYGAGVTFSILSALVILHDLIEYARQPAPAASLHAGQDISAH
ncbi:TRAP transporter small permease [Corticimicrobacter populi]|uniref:TRAP transporter small permease protein n=1 Tax=Corticimicrobacter populi TaxID=2175229 RepID=A0A2V1JWP9_9BURK|nr:TRAP transporter small permease [Corticimicrobacter populi]PWF22757.1 TRAP transporter small permease [Corticimicrobacter populi]